MIIALFNAKGGVGKSTCSVHLSYYLYKVLKKTTQLIDADPMRISSFWLSQLKLDIPITQLTDPNDFLEQITTLSSQTEYTIIDCPANASEMNRAIIFALSPIDILLIPIKPTSVDKVASNPTLRLIKQAKLHGKGFKSVTFVSMGHRARAITGETLEYLRNKQNETEIKVLNSILYDKATIADALDENSVIWQMDRAKREQKELKSWCEEVLRI